MTKGICFSLRNAEESIIVQGFPSTLGLIYNEPSPPSNMKIIRDGLFGQNPTKEHVNAVIKRIHERQWAVMSEESRQGLGGGETFYINNGNINSEDI